MNDRHNSFTTHPEHTVGRRTFLASAAGGALLSLLPEANAHPLQAAAKQEATNPAALIIRAKSPDNLESPFAMLDSYVTPTHQFYIRSHFEVPDLKADTFRLRVEGAVEKPLELKLEDLQRMPQKTLLATMECAGNGRIFLTPATQGVQWEHGAVGTGEWIGVPLVEVLQRAGLKPEAFDVVLEGADRGEIRTPPRPAGPIPFARSLPLAQAQNPDVLLAHTMNGAPLTPSRGYPLRAVVPGWYGMASIKWLTRILVTDRPFDGYYQTLDYAYWEVRNGLPTRVPITTMLLKSAIARPTMQEVVSGGQPYRVRGAAWGGGGGEKTEVSKVEVSVDGGRSWNAARLLDPPQRYVWRRWEYLWPVPKQAGRHTVMARATDAQGRVQPMERDGNRENYMIQHVIPVSVTVV